MCTTEHIPTSLKVTLDQNCSFFNNLTFISSSIFCYLEMTSSRKNNKNSYLS